MSGVQKTLDKVNSAIGSATKAVTDVPTEAVTARPVAMVLAVFNFLVFVLIIFATASQWWSWGSYLGSTPNGGGQQPPYSTYAVATSPFVATYVNGQLTSRPCAQCPTRVERAPVMWNQLNGKNACNPKSFVYKVWSGPTAYGYCSNSTAAAASGNGTSNMVFTAPEWLDSGALMISACVFMFIVMVLTVMELALPNDKMVLAALTFFSLLVWVLVVAATGRWLNAQWVVDVAVPYVGAFTPVWLTSGELTAVPVVMVLGPSFGAAIAVWVYMIIAFVYYAYLLITLAAEEKPAAAAEKKAEPAPAAAAPAQAQPAAAPAPEAAAAPAQTTSVQTA